VTTTLTATVQPAGVLLEVATDEATAAYATITRTANGVTSFVRWARVAQIDTALTVLDLEVPTDVLVSYALSVENVSRAELDADTATATYVSDGVDRLINFSGPGLVREVTVSDFPRVTSEARIGVFDILGRRNRIAVTDVRSGESGQITLVEDDQGESLRAWLADGSTIGLRTPAGRGYGTPAAFSVGRVATERVSIAGDQLRLVTLEVTEVDVPVPSLGASAPITWASVMAYAATWADVKAEPGWPTWYKVKTVPTTAL
jgi:hypothetical protein